MGPLPPARTGTPAGHAHVFAASVAVVDLPGREGPELVPHAGRGGRRHRRPGLGRGHALGRARLAELLGRDLAAEPATTGAREALVRALS